ASSGKSGGHGVRVSRLTIRFFQSVHLVDQVGVTKVGRFAAADWERLVFCAAARVVVLAFLPAMLVEPHCRTARSRAPLELTTGSLLFGALFGLGLLALGGCRGNLAVHVGGGLLGGLEAQGRTGTRLAHHVEKQVQRRVVVVPHPVFAFGFDLLYQICSLLRVRPPTICTSGRVCARNDLFLDRLLHIGPLF